MVCAPTTTMLCFCGVRFLQGLSLHCLWSFEVDSVFYYGYFKPWAAFWQKINAQEIIFWCWKFSTKKYVNKICNIWKNFPSAQIFCQKALNSRKNSRNLIFNPQPLEAVRVLKGSHILMKPSGCNHWNVIKQWNWILVTFRRRKCSKTSPKNSLRHSLTTEA